MKKINSLEIEKMLNNPIIDRLPKSGKIMGIDVGTKKIGIAISDETRLIATPKLILQRKSNQVDFDKIFQIVKENYVVAIVIGVPMKIDGSITEMTLFALNFSSRFDIFLENKIPIFNFDERLSSFEAKEIAKSNLSRKRSKGYNFVDDIAASFILQHFLDYIR